MCWTVFSGFYIPTEQPNIEQPQKKEFIKWIDFNPTSEVIKKTISLVNHNLKKESEFAFPDFFEILAFVALKNSNKFNNSTDSKLIDKLKKSLDNLENPIDKFKGNKYFKYYDESFRAILSGIVGFKGEEKKEFAIIGHHPIARGYWYGDSDDFGNSRSFGFKRKHLGHDMFGNIGTPIMAMEGGTITELGWNRYGGWRIGITSLDTKRYYYYAHLRNKIPYPPEFKIGDKVESGQLIGYLGNTGYGKKGSVLKNTSPHLHLGLQIIFDPCQIKGPKEIWVDIYQIVRLLCGKRVQYVKPKPNATE
ncbi:MAG: M23 family metallopeptidase [Clostridiales bacterium]|nr:M23 family metallopeptidase [Clostridiales bacterium]